LLSDGLTNEDSTNENEINKSKDLHTVSFENIQKDGIKDENLEGVTNGDDDFTVTKVTSVDDLKNNDNISSEQLVLENEALRKEIELKDKQLKEGLIMITQKLNKKFEEKNNRLIESQQKLVTKTDQLIADVTSLKSSPVFHACAYHGYQTIISERITYSKHLYWSRSNNQGTLDLNTGVFTSGVSGTYTIAWNLRVGNDYNDNNVRIFLRKNGENIRESRHYSEYTGLMGYSSDQGGRTLLVHLDSGETLDLFCEDCQAGVYGITVCVSLATKDESNALDMETHADFNRALYSSRYGHWN